MELRTKLSALKKCYIYLGSYETLKKSLNYSDEYFIEDIKKLTRLSEKIEENIIRKVYWFRLSAKDICK